MFELQFFLIGIIQGFTEFLPISSSGHLVLFAQLTNWKDQGLFTDISVHFGTLFAVVIYLRKDIYYFLTNIFQFKLFEDQIIFAKSGPVGRGLAFLLEKYFSKNCKYLL